MPFDLPNGFVHLDIVIYHSPTYVLLSDQLPF